MSFTDQPCTTVRLLDPQVRRADDGRGFYARVEYATDDGRTFTGNVPRRLKRDVLPAVEALAARAERGQVTVTLRDGVMVGTALTYSLR